MNDLPDDLIRLVLAATYPTQMPHMMMVCKKWNTIMDVKRGPINKVHIIASVRLMKWYVATHGPRLGWGLLKTIYRTPRGSMELLEILYATQEKPCRHALEYCAIMGHINMMVVIYDLVDRSNLKLMLLAEVTGMSSVIEYLKYRRHLDPVGDGDYIDRDGRVTSEGWREYSRVYARVRRCIMTVTSLPSRPCEDDE